MLQIHELSTGFNLVSNWTVWNPAAAGIITGLPAESCGARALCVGRRITEPLVCKWIPEAISGQSRWLLSRRWENSSAATSWTSCWLDATKRPKPATNPQIRPQRIELQHQQAGGVSGDVLESFCYPTEPVPGLQGSKRPKVLLSPAAVCSSSCQGGTLSWFLALPSTVYCVDVAF